MVLDSIVSDMNKLSIHIHIYIYDYWLEGSLLKIGKNKEM